MAEEALRKVSGRPRHIAWRAHEALVELGCALPEARVLRRRAPPTSPAWPTRARRRRWRSSPRLRAEGAHVDYHDPLVPTLDGSRASVDLDPARRAGFGPEDYDLAILATLHPEPRLRLARALPGGAGLHLPHARTPASDASCREHGARGESMPSSDLNVNRVLKVLAGLYLSWLLAAVMAYKAAFARAAVLEPVLRRLQHLRSRPTSSRASSSASSTARGRDAGIEPRIAIVMPGFNEEEAIAQSLRSLLALDYPEEKLELVAVNDGSTDTTLAEMQRVAADCEGRVSVINFPREPRQARGDGRRHPRHLRRGDRVRGLRLLGRARRAQMLVQPLADPPRGGRLRSRRRAQRARELDHADAGRALLRRLPRREGRGVGLRRGDLLLGLLLGLPPRGDHAAPGVVGEPDLPRHRVDLRR